MLPNGGFWHLGADPQYEQGWQHADKEYCTPAKMWKHNDYHECGDCFADGVRGLHQTEGLAAMFGAPCFGDQRGACGPFAAHPESKHKPAHGELWNRVRERAGSARRGVDE